MEFVATKNLLKCFKNTNVLSDIDLTIEKGEIYGLIGNNGAGKTTLLRIICNLLQPTKGEVLWNKQAFSSKVPMGSLIEHPALYFDMSAYENIKAKAIALGVKYYKSDIDALLKLVGLENTDKKRVRAFSMGMKQRLGIALALVGEPDLLILDEPINGLDPQGISEVRNMLLKIHEERGVTMVISSHILDELAKIATRFCVLHKGKLVKNCSKEEFMSECGDRDIDEYYLQILKENE